MDGDTIVNYFKNYIEIVFESEKSTFFMLGNLVCSDNETIRCTCSFTIKKDGFDMPVLIVGCFLPFFD